MTWRPGRPPPLRLLDDAEGVASVLLAILFAHLVGARHVNWAAFSGYMVLRGHWADSCARGLLRIVGTGAGAALALAAGPWLGASWPAAALAAGVVGGLSLYAALTAKRAYAWLFVGLTFLLVLFDGTDRTPAALWPTALTRVAEVCAGTAACLVVSGLSAVTLRRRWPGARLPRPQRLGWHGPAARHAAQGGVAVALVAVLAGLGRLGHPAQAGISVLASMVVPASVIGAGGLGPVSRKLGQRVAGCAAGGLFAAAALLLAGARPVPLLAATALGVALGRHGENGGHPHAYAGTQFTLAVLVTIVPDSYATAAVGPALERLGGIVAGLLVLEPVLVAWHLLAPGRRRATPTGTGPIAGE